MCSILFVLYIYLPSLHGHDVKMSKRVYTSYDDFLSEVDMITRNSTQGEFANI